MRGPLNPLLDAIMEVLSMPRVVIVEVSTFYDKKFGIESASSLAFSGGFSTSPTAREYF